MNPRARRVGAITLRHLRRITRERLITWSLILGAIAWYASPSLRADPRSATALVLSVALLTVLLCGAGTIADEMASGSHMLDVAHGATPGELALGATTGVLGSAMPAVLLSGAGLLTAGQPSTGGALLLLCTVIAAATAWSALVVLAGTLFPGKGNAAALAPLFLFGGFAATELPLGALPLPLAETIRFIWSTLPLHAHVAAVRDRIILGSPTDAWPYIALIGGPPLFILLATLRLQRLEAVARWRQ